jgi:hypothetical protein
VTPGWRSQSGFSLLEALVATAITVAVTAGVFAVVGSSQGIADTQPEFADMQQRLRVAVDVLRHDLLMAGAGAYMGTGSGSLVARFAPVLPFRRGASAAYDDGAGVFSANAITIVYVPSTASQTTLRSALTDMSRADLNSGPGCPAGDAVCGFRPGAAAAVYDGTGAFDLFAVTSVDTAGALGLQHMQRGAVAKPYAAGSKIVEVVRHSYFLDAPGTQLMRYDGLASANVVLENIVSLDFEYFGEPAPPALSHPGVDQSVTYGPAPPAPDVSQDPWPPGENCTWQMVGGEQVPRLAFLGSFGQELVRLTAAQLTDGPWCPDAASDNRYDADLLRIRTVRTVIRLQTGNAALRASLASGRGALFANPGTATNASRTVPDQSIRFDVTPRNMNLGR